MIKWNMIKLLNMIIFLIIGNLNEAHSNKVASLLTEEKEQENDKVAAEELIAERNNSDQNVKEIDRDLTNIVKCLDQSPQYRRRPDKVRYSQLSTLGHVFFSIN